MSPAPPGLEARRGWGAGAAQNASGVDRIGTEVMMSGLRRGERSAGDPVPFFRAIAE